MAGAILWDFGSGVQWFEQGDFDWLEFWVIEVRDGLFVRTSASTARTWLPDWWCFA